MPINKETNQTKEKDSFRIKNCVDVSIQGNEDYIKKSKERLITVASNTVGNMLRNRKPTKTRKQKWKET